ncbi:MAG: hypothetical protein CM1200mP41_05340 [Gammaproteobacteria bacterium]|nr:MAG: hypothetical protein CM1200mP41_05340 [Gammaproteobacteria bacterium]
MQIGPRSAGASPGPVCYGLGGSEPTVTDANVVLGYLNPDYLVGGELKIDSELSHSVLSNVVAIPLGIDLVEAAHGAHEIAAANMIRAVKAVSSERGRDPRSYAMVAFGGNGPLFAGNHGEGAWNEAHTDSTESRGILSLGVVIGCGGASLLSNIAARITLDRSFGI